MTDEVRCRCSEWAEETYGIVGPCPWHRERMAFKRAELGRIAHLQEAAIHNADQE